MSKLGSLIGAALIGLVMWLATGWVAAFWIFFCFSAIIGLPIGTIMDVAYRRRMRRERLERALLKHRRTNFHQYDQMIQRTLRQGTQTVVNIDARSVHYHGKEEAPKGFVDKP